MVSGNKCFGQKQEIGAKILWSGNHYLSQQKRRQAENRKTQIKNNQCEQIQTFFFPGDSNEDADTKSEKDKPYLIKFDPSTRRPLTVAWSKLIKSNEISA